MKMALLSSSSSSPTKPHITSFTSPSSKPHHTHKPYLLNLPKRPHLYYNKATTDNAATLLETPSQCGSQKNDADGGTPIDEKLAELSSVKKFEDSRWVSGTWDLKQFEKNGVTHWDALIDAEAKRRKWLETYPESTNNNEPVIFDTSIIPWWAWMKRFHLPEAELLNGRAAMVGFFMAYFVDSLTGVGLVDQMSNFFCKTLLFVAVLGVLLIRKNEDVENLKKLFEETTFYDKQWQATWQDETKKEFDTGSRGFRTRFVFVVHGAVTSTTRSSNETLTIFEFRKLLPTSLARDFNIHVTITITSYTVPSLVPKELMIPISYYDADHGFPTWRYTTTSVVYCF